MGMLLADLKPEAIEARIAGYGPVERMAAANRLLSEAVARVSLGDFEGANTLIKLAQTAESVCFGILNKWDPYPQDLYRGGPYIWVWQSEAPVLVTEVRVPREMQFSIVAGREPLRVVEDLQGGDGTVQRCLRLAPTVVTAGVAVCVTLMGSPGPLRGPELRGAVLSATDAVACLSAPTGVSAAGVHLAREAFKELRAPRCEFGSGCAVPEYEVWWHSDMGNRRKVACKKHLEEAKRYLKQPSGVVAAVDVGYWSVPVAALERLRKLLFGAKPG